jgi:hypothetical protein
MDFTYIDVSKHYEYEYKKDLFGNYKKKNSKKE